MTAEPFTNRLIHEKSPYLLQHAHNPVDWYAWGEEAFEKAKREDKPIFLSIGYSTCHWCHVMEDESFSDPKTAELMNQHFVSIKVDREERPDLDHIYMNYVIATTGSGGWPMTVFLTPDKKPFYGGTYFPPQDRFGLPGFKTLLNSMADAWKNRREEILKSADHAASFLQKQGQGSAAGELTKDVLKNAVEEYRARFDAEHGGFGRAPKFPMGHALAFLLRAGKRFNDPEALQMVDKTLTSMANGGLYDQLGGGFHRYSTDAQWRVPHFEKMLYDQALLSKVYLEAYQTTHDERFSKIARETLDYVLREMTGPEGGFYSAQDADSADPSDPSKKREGAYYVWKKSEIDALFSKKDAEAVASYFGIAEEGNAIQDPQGEFKGKNVLYAAGAPDDKIPSGARQVLLAARSKRQPPHVDDKVLTDWNGLMIASLAHGARVLEEPRYRQAAEKCANFISTRLRDKNGNLLHRYRDGEAAITAHLDDFAFFIAGELALYEATFDGKWLRQAQADMEKMIELFWDEQSKGFFLTSKESTDLISRPKQDQDSAIPSGNSVAAMNCLKLSRFIGNSRYENFASEIFKVFSADIKNQPSGFAECLSAFDFAVGPSMEIVIAPDAKESNMREIIREIYSHFIPNKVVMLKADAPFLKDAKPLNGKTTVYVCQNYQCQLPVNDVGQLKKVMNSEL